MQSYPSCANTLASFSSFLAGGSCRLAAGRAAIPVPSASKRRLRAQEQTTPRSIRPTTRARWRAARAADKTASRNALRAHIKSMARPTDRRAAAPLTAGMAAETADRHTRARLPRRHKFRAACRPMAEPMARATHRPTARLSSEAARVHRALPDAHAESFQERASLTASAKEPTPAQTPRCRPAAPSFAFRDARARTRPRARAGAPKAFLEPLASRTNTWEPIYLAYPSASGGNRALHDSLAAFARKSFARFGVQTLLRGPAIVVRILAALLVPWTVLLALADSPRFFPWWWAKWGWGLFDCVMTAALFGLAARWRRLLGVAAAITADARCPHHRGRVPGADLRRRDAVGAVSRATRSDARMGS